ncbi:MAG: hypothetical protein ABSD44_16735, partial [Terracidiphilus sp.]
MIRSIFQAFFCLILCPLLATQQVAGEAPQRPSQETAAAPAPTAYAAIPEDAKIELTLMDSDALKSAKAGSYLLLAVAKNVTVDGVTVLRAGTCLTGTITAEKH